VDSLAPLARAYAIKKGAALPAGHPLLLFSHSSQESAAIRQLQDQMSTLLSVIPSGAPGSQQPGGGEPAVGFAVSTPGAPAVSETPRKSPVDEAYEKDYRMEAMMVMTGFKDPEIDRPEFFDMTEASRAAAEREPLVEFLPDDVTDASDSEDDRDNGGRVACGSSALAAESFLGPLTHLHTGMAPASDAPEARPAVQGR
jgi:hypothetical protein